MFDARKELLLPGYRSSCSAAPQFNIRAAPTHIRILPATRVDRATSHQRPEIPHTASIRIGLHALGTTRQLWWAPT